MLSDIDSRDWERPGVDAIVEAATLAAAAAATILLHDAGGDRSQTVAALDRLILQLQQQGYTLHHRHPGRRPAGSGTRGRSGDHGRRCHAARRGVRRDPARRRPRMGAARRRCAGRCVRLLVMIVVAGRHRRQRNAPGWSWGPPVDEPVSVDRAGVQRARVHRDDPGFARRERPPRGDRRRRRRFHRRNRRPGPVSGTAERPGDPPGQCGQGRRPEHRRGRRPTRADRDDGRRHGVRADDRAQAGAAVRRPGGRRRGRQRQGRQPRAG